MDPVTCCLLGICCPPGSSEQLATFEGVLAEHFGGDSDKAAKVVEKMRDDLIKFSEKLAKAWKDEQEAA